jgi:murein DD-endopeptidase MepM/ murein hydrolase activator NlpD
LQKGDQIGIVGMAGTLSSGPHLHVELWKNGSHIDPMLYFVE